MQGLAVKEHENWRRLVSPLDPHRLTLGYDL
jgi:hypothetical protein